MYTCPMHPEIKVEKPGHCPICGMNLILENQVLDSKIHKTSNQESSYKPLIIIISLILLVTAIVGIRDYYIHEFAWKSLMMNFMAGFFLVFSGFKLLNINGFAEGYSTYDLLAKKLYTYGYIYPFIELSLGIVFVLHFSSLFINLFTFILMAFSGVGVAIKLIKHEKFQCACLGTFLKVPLTKVTLIEDFGMAAMALVMIFIK